jgi:deoxyribodipyrimidine photolyase
VPELAGVPAPTVFAPWKDPALLGRTGYPAPIVEVDA